MKDTEARKEVCKLREELDALEKSHRITANDVVSIRSDMKDYGVYECPKCKHQTLQKYMVHPDVAEWYDGYRYYSLSYGYSPSPNKNCRKCLTCGAILECHSETICEPVKQKKKK